MKYLIIPISIVVIYVAFAMGNACWDPFAWPFQARVAHVVLQIAWLLILASYWLINDLK